MADTGFGDDFVGVTTVLEASMGCGEFMILGRRVSAAEPDREAAGSAMSQTAGRGVA